MTQQMVKEETLEEKWNFYTGTGINAKKGDDALALREKPGGGEYAIVELIGGCWTNSPMRVIEEIKAGELGTAKARFDQVASELGFQGQPVRGIEQLFLSV